MANNRVIDSVHETALSPLLLLSRPQEPIIDTSTAKQDTLLFDRLLLEKYNPAEQQARKSLFTGHSLSKKSKEAIPFEKSELSHQWIFGLIILITILWAFLIKTYHSKSTLMLKSCFSNRQLNMLMKDDEVGYEKQLLPIFVSTLLVIGLFVLYLCFHFNSLFFKNQPEITNFFIIFGILTIYYLLKFGLVNFLGRIFKSSKISSYFIVNQICFLLLVSIVLMPLLFILFFAPYYIADVILNISIVLFSILFIASLIRSFIIVLSYSGFSKLYLFYYLCIVEIVPPLIIAKILISS